MTSQHSWGQQYAMAGDVPGLDPHAATGVAAWFTPALTAAMGAIGLWLANRLVGKAALDQVVNARMKEYLDRIEAERVLTETKHAAKEVAWAAERAQLRGEIINLTQAIESLKSYLRRNGLDIPETHRPAPDYEIIPGSDRHD